jgi:hypothetical protein
MSLKRSIIRALAYPFLWPVIHMPGRSWTGTHLPLETGDRTVRERVERIVRELSDKIGERHAQRYESLQAAEQLIKRELEALGYSVNMQGFRLDGVLQHNIECQIKGSMMPEEVVVVGAHYDSVVGSPGADDNATGISALLAIAAALRNSNPARTIRFVAFANEENPFHKNEWEAMGSYAYAQECRSRGDNIVGMISLEMLGVYSDEPGSQQYPSPFNLLYPDVGNFLGFVGNLRSRRWVQQCIASFRKHARIPSEGVAAPERFRDINRSDHWSFWQFDYPGLMITDTSNFRNKLYHTQKDTPCIIDFDRLAKATVALTSMVQELASK